MTLNNVTSSPDSPINCSATPLAPQPLISTLLPTSLLPMDMDYEDDGFYAEIRRQILLLTAEDDDDYRQTETNNSPPTRGAANLCRLRHASYFSWCDGEKTNSAPTWLSTLWRNDNSNRTGTGVFIPHINNSRRCQRPSRMRKRKNTQATACRNQTIMNQTGAYIS